MLKSDLAEIKDVVKEAVKTHLGSVDVALGSLVQSVGSIEERLGSLENKLEETKQELKVDIADVKFETAAIHLIIEGQNKDQEKRFLKIEKHIGISPDQ